MLPLPLVNAVKVARRFMPDGTARGGKFDQEGRRDDEGVYTHAGDPPRAGRGRPRLFPVEAREEQKEVILLFFWRL